MDCCPLVVDPLTFAALIGAIALATYFFERWLEYLLNKGLTHVPSILNPFKTIEKAWGNFCDGCQTLQDRFVI